MRSNIVEVVSAWSQGGTSHLLTFRPPSAILRLSFSLGVLVSGSHSVAIALRYDLRLSDQPIGNWLDSG